MAVPVTSALSLESQEAWVESRLVASLLHAARALQMVGSIAVFVLVAVLWSTADRIELLSWAGLALLLLFIRRGYILHEAELSAQGLDAAGERARMVRFERYRHLWPAHALVWGAGTWLHFDRVPLAEQFTCWLIVGGLSMFSVNTLSSHLPTMRAYLNMVALTALAIIIWKTVFVHGLRAPTYQFWLLAVVAVFWITLRHAAYRLHLTHRSNFELQYRNAQLIESLTRQTQAALDAVEIKNRFLASAAHDLRQPVHALGLYADWLGSEPELVNELAPKIVQSTRAVNALFDSLFDLARLDAGQVRLSIAPVDLQQLVHEIELQYRPLAQARGLELRTHLAPGTAMSDPILLRRIVGNLVSNAIKYTNTGGVLLALRARPRGMCIEVWDTGVGIAAEHQREVFREFFKVPGHTGTDDGFGLGLYIVSRLSEILGHDLTMGSTPGRGSVFRLTLLPTDPEAAAQRAAAAVAQALNRP